jgi:hypothetical protein
MCDGRVESGNSRILVRGMAKLRDGRGKYVRYKRGKLQHTRQRADGSADQDVRWTAVIVESVRVNGKPRQRHVAWLASITKSLIEVDHRRRYFWDAVYERLDRLGNLISIDERRHIEAAVALKVPRLSREEHNASVKYIQAKYPDVE